MSGGWGARVAAVLGAVAVTLPGPTGSTAAPGADGPRVRSVAVVRADPPDPNPVIVPSDPGPPDAVPPDPGPPPAVDGTPDGTPDAVAEDPAGAADGTADAAAPARPKPAQPGPSDLAGFFRGALNWTSHGSFGLDRAHAVPDRTAPTGHLLRVDYPAGSASPTVTRDSGAPSGGAQSYLHLSHPADVMTVSYSVRFPAGFRFVKGGKLPGLFGGDAGSGGHHQLAGFSTRFMWRAGGAGEVYAYLPNDKGYGASLGRGRWTFVPGRWTKLTQRVTLNAPGRSDGTITVWINGRQMFSRGGLVLRNSAAVHVDGLFFSTFFGGGDKTWVSPTDQHVDFAGFGFTPGRAPGPRPGPARGPAPGAARPPAAGAHPARPHTPARPPTRPPPGIRS